VLVVGAVFTSVMVVAMFSISMGVFSVVDHVLTLIGLLEEAEGTESNLDGLTFREVDSTSVMFMVFFSVSMMVGHMVAMFTSMSMMVAHMVAMFTSVSVVVAHMVPMFASMSVMLGSEGHSGDSKEGDGLLHD